MTLTGSGLGYTLKELSSGPLIAYVLILAFCFGTAFGSFMNCMAWRLVHGESVVKGRSHCADCGHPLGARDLIPVLSYLLLRGKFRYCGQKISPRYLAAELVCGAGWVCCILRWGLTPLALRNIILFCILLALSLTDLESMIIPDRFLIAALVNWAIFLPFMEGGAVRHLVSGLLGAAALGGGMLCMTLLFDRLTGKESMGGGDIKLYFICGFYLGPAKGLLCLILSCILGLVTAAIGKKGRSRPFPFGPSIAMALFICLLVGDALINWYLSLIL